MATANPLKPLNTTKTTERELREKSIVSGPGALSDAELLALLIREGNDMLTATELAEKILEDFGGSLAELATAEMSRIRRAAGCGTVKATSIAAAAEFARRVTAEKSLTVTKITSKDDIVRLFSPLADLPHEEFWVVYLTSGGKIIDRARLSQGGVTATVVDHKLLVKRAVELLASSIILVHNHPSGLSKPSRNDMVITETVSRAAALFDIKTVDHVIISAAGSFSFAENGKMPPPPRKP